MSGSALLALYGHVAALLAPLFACAAIGAWWGRRRNDYPGSFISTLAADVATPALVFHTLLTTALDDRLLLQLGAAALAGLLLAAALAALLLWLARLPVAVLLPSITFPNAGNLGLPVAYLAFGEEGLTAAVVFFTVGTLAQNTLGVWLVSRGGTGPQRKWPLGVVLACVAALALRLSGLPAPEALLASARLVGSLAVPLMLLSLGHALATVSHAGLRQGSLLAAARFVCGGLAGWAVVRGFGLPPATAGAIMLQMLMPVAVINYLYAARFSDRGDTVAGAVVLSTVAFVLLSPLLLWWTGSTSL